MSDYEIFDHRFGWHRDTNFRNLVMFKRPFCIDGMSVLVATLDSDNKWWIIPDEYDHEEVFQDMGPYDTVEEAIMYLKLYGTTK